MHAKEIREIDATMHVCTVGLFLAMYSGTEESLMGHAHEFSTVVRVRRWSTGTGAVPVGWIGFRILPVPTEITPACSLQLAAVRMPCMPS